MIGALFHILEWDQNECHKAGRRFAKFLDHAYSIAITTVERAASLAGWPVGYGKSRWARERLMANDVRLIRRALNGLRFCQDRIMKSFLWFRKSP